MGDLKPSFSTQYLTSQVVFGVVVRIEGTEGRASGVILNSVPEGVTVVECRACNCRPVLLSIWGAWNGLERLGSRKSSLDIIISLNSAQ